MADDKSPANPLDAPAALSEPKVNPLDAPAGMPDAAASPVARSSGRSGKAYLNADFLKSPDARMIRMLAEYLEPQRRFAKQNIADTILFFGSARIVSREQAQAELAAAKAGIGDVRAV